MTDIFTGKTIEEAQTAASKKFGVPISAISFEILEEPKKGFMGIGSRDAKIKATAKDMASAPAVKPAAPKAVSEPPKTESPAPAPAKPVTAAAAPKQTESAAPSPAPVKEEKTPEAAVPKREKTPRELDEDEYSLDNFTLIENEAEIDPKVVLAIDYMKSIFTAMGITVNCKVYQNESGAVIDVDSDNNGTVIGRRGETLDAVQYLCSIIANKGDKDYYRITIACFGYRQKRKETLQQLAAKVAKSVMRTGRSQPLEPMNPYERRVIHSAISEIDGVTSRSVGEEPYRKIIISSTNPRRNNGNRRRNDNRGGRGGNNRRGGARRPRSREPFEARAIDLSTSFEKDYKKPKPEDSIEGGLYGKIEF